MTKQWPAPPPKPRQPEFRMMLNCDADAISTGRSTSLTYDSAPTLTIVLHRQCLLDECTTPSICPSCHTDVTSLSPRGRTVVIVNIDNEGGRQTEMDILPVLTEENLLRAYPETRRSRVFLDYSRASNAWEIVDMIKEADGSDSEDADGVKQLPVSQMLRYQDPLDKMHSALHIHIMHKDAQAALWLLFKASPIPLSSIPPEILAEFESVGEVRDPQEGLVDIRSLKDVNGRTAADYARDTNWDFFPVSLLEASE